MDNIDLPQRRAQAKELLTLLNSESLFTFQLPVRPPENATDEQLQEMNAFYEQVKQQVDKQLDEVLTYVASQFTAEELQEMIALVQTPVGQNLMNKLPVAINKAFAYITHPIMEQASSALWQRYMQIFNSPPQTKKDDKPHGFTVLDGGKNNDDNNGDDNPDDS
tara:strand:+ start:386 stop:877 length:492 start_codon:yes stop_codon:yes gene_type:complete